MYTAWLQNLSQKKEKKKKNADASERPHPLCCSFMHLSMAHTKASWPNHKKWDAEALMRAQWNADEEGAILAWTT